MQSRQFNQAQKSLEISHGNSLQEGVRTGTSRQYRLALPLRMKLHFGLVRTKVRAYILWCEVRSLVHRIRGPRSRTEYLLPSQYLHPCLLRDRHLKSSAISASIDCIESVKAQMPWASLFDLSLVLQGWAAGAAWAACNPHLGTDSCNGHSGNGPCVDDESPVALNSER